VALQSLRTERKALTRLLARLAVDHTQAEKAPELRAQGEVLKVQLHAVPQGASEVTLCWPWLPDQPIVVQLQRELSPQQNVERLFRRARGLEQGLRMIAERQTAAQAKLAEVEQLLATLPVSPDETAPAEVWTAWRTAVDGWLAAVRRLRLRVARTPEPESAAERKAAKQAGRDWPKGVQRFTSPAGALVLAGRDAKANDVLVTRLMRGRDRWFHRKDQPGAHVLLRVDGKQEPVEAELRACAVLCAHLSGVDKGSVADVTMAAGRHVRKVKGSATGSVYVSEERVLRVVVEAAVVDGFYARRPPM
jgi:predicted ribosome quality control (RQC) complex YloA/Tae2 family protein